MFEAERPPVPIRRETTFSRDVCLASLRTMYRVPAAAGETGERRAQRGPMKHATPTLAATAPIQLMVLITREQYPHGKLDLIRSASLLVRDESQVVRTAATEMIVVSFQSIARIRQCKPMEPEARRLAEGALEGRGGRPGRVDSDAAITR